MELNQSKYEHVVQIDAVVKGEDEFSARRSGYDPCLLATLTQEAHVWLARPQLTLQADRRNDLLSMLDETEKDRYNRFVFDKDRNHFLAAHALVRTVLSRYVEVPPNAWRFAASKYGRPEIVAECGAPRLRCNLSHTNGLVACVVSHEIDCGIDVEAIRPFANYLAIAKWMFTADEYEHLLGAPIDKRHEVFFSYWTLKEAYIKARGLGLSLSTTGFRFCIEASGKVSIRFNDDGDDRASAWQFQLSRPTDAHLLAVAIAPGSRGNYAFTQRWLWGES